MVASYVMLMRDEMTDCIMSNGINITIQDNNYGVIRTYLWKFLSRNALSR